MECRQLLAADSLGVTPLDTGEFLLGTVSVTPVFFDSTGETDPKTQQWSDEVNEQGLDEIDQVMVELNAGLDWWVDTLDTFNSVHSLEFQVDETYVQQPFLTSFEPIDRNGADFVEYVTEFVVDRGYSDASSIEEGVRRFNQDQRLQHGTDWALTIFVVDASDDADGRFETGPGHRGAFAFAGGLFMVIPSTRTAEIFAHELGHIFWAMDEYPSGASWEDQRGYYNGNAWNAADNTAPDFMQEISIMRGFLPLEQAFEQNVSPASTLAFVGWQDSDGDGVFDVADVPLDLDAYGYFDPETSEYHLHGTAAAVPLINKNSSGPQSDITLNRVSEIQYRLDDGPWTTATAPDQPRVEFQISLPILVPFAAIQWRAIDSSTGITSAIIEGTPTLPALAAASVSGVAFLDSDNNGGRSENEIVLANTTAKIRNLDGSPVFGGAINANDFPDGILPDPMSGLMIQVTGEDLHTNVGSFVSFDAGDQRVFHSFDTSTSRWLDRWSANKVFGAQFDQPVGQVTIDVVGLRDQSIGRLEGYDAAGNLVARATTDTLAAGSFQTLMISDRQNRIDSIRAFGHAKTIVALQRLAFGVKDTYVIGEAGSFRFENVADGQYEVELIPELIIHQFDNPVFNIEVSGGTSELVMASADTVDSIRHNTASPYDVTGTDGVTALDALVIINDIGRNSRRILEPHETDGFDVDVNNDGIVSALDALVVINFLGRGDSEAQMSSDGSELEGKSVQMLNLAGRAAAVKSAGADYADTDDRTDDAVVIGRKSESMIARQERPQTVGNGFGENDQNDSESSHSERLGDDIDPEFEEPFVGFEV